MSIIVPKLDPCPFCEGLADRLPFAFVSRGDRVSAFMNRAQYERGALLVVPNAHYESILEVDSGLLADVYSAVRQITKVMVPLLGATGIGVFQNNGVAAGQTVGHYHVHVVPRYPSSDPGRRFREADFPHTPFAELEAIASKLREALEK